MGSHKAGCPFLFVLQEKIKLIKVNLQEVLCMAFSLLICSAMIVLWNVGS